jgi:hypothetical protein
MSVDFTEWTSNAVRVSKADAVELYAVCRQAERSIDHALHGAEQWAGLLHYYNADRRDRLRRVTARLSRVCEGRSAPSRTSVLHLSTRCPLKIVAAMLANRLRNKWSFHPQEVAFIVSAMHAMTEFLAHERMPDSQSLVDCRMDLRASEDIIEMRLIRVPELRVAVRIEHYCQPAHLQSVSFADLGIE